MKIALVSLHYAEYASRLALAFDPCHDVLLVLDCSNADYDLSTSLRDALNKRGNVLWFAQQRRRTAPFDVMRLTREILRFRPDVIHVQEVGSSVPTWTNDVLRYSIPLVLTVHDPIPHSGADQRWSERTASFRVRLRNRADRLIVHGERIREEWQERKPESAFRLASVHHGVLGDDQGRLETIPEKPPVFLFFGRIEAYKGLEYALQATELLASRGLRFRLVIAGTGSELDRHRVKIGQMSCVELIDRRFPADELPQIFRRASAVLLPYTDATQSGVAAMAFGFGRPVIATDVGGLPDVVTNEHNGLLVPAKNVAALADAMSRFIATDKLDERLRHGAMECARRELSWNVIARETTAVYEGAIRAHQRTPNASLRLDGLAGHSLTPSD